MRSIGLSESARKVAELIDHTLFNGSDKIKVKFNGNVHEIYGYTNHPSRGQGNISDWTSASKHDDIVNEVIDNVNSMFSGQGGISENSITLYYPKNLKPVLDKDYVTGQPSKTVRQRLLDIPEIKEIKYAEKLADNNIVYVEMMERTVQVARASDIIAVPHTNTHPFQSQQFTTYASMVMYLRTDANGNTGILHCTVS